MARSVATDSISAQSFKSRLRQTPIDSDWGQNEWASSLQLTVWGESVPGSL